MLINCYLSFKFQIKMLNKLYILIAFIVVSAACFAQQQVPFQNKEMQNKALQQNTTLESGTKPRLTKDEIRANIAKQKEIEKEEVAKQKANDNDKTNGKVPDNVSSKANSIQNGTNKLPIEPLIKFPTINLNSSTKVFQLKDSSELK